RARPAPRRCCNRRRRYGCGRLGRGRSAAFPSPSSRWVGEPVPRILAALPREKQNGAGEITMSLVTPGAPPPLRRGSAKALATSTRQRPLPHARRHFITLRRFSSIHLLACAGS